MLTKKQLEQLQPLTLHPKFGKLLKAAIIKWKKYKPVRGCMGIEYDPNTQSFKRWRGVDGCCLLGASICERKTINSNYKDQIIEKFKLELENFYGLMLGFDNHFGVKSFKKSEAYKFGEEVNKIVKPEVKTYRMI